MTQASPGRDIRDNHYATELRVSPDRDTNAPRLCVAVVAFYFAGDSITSRYDRITKQLIKLKLLRDRPTTLTTATQLYGTTCCKSCGGHEFLNAHVKKRIARRHKLVQRLTNTLKVCALTVSQRTIDEKYDIRTTTLIESRRGTSIAMCGIEMKTLETAFAVDY